jgi:hypothetical protein
VKAVAPPPRPRRAGRSNPAGVALLMVITSIAILAIIVVEFANAARTHLDQGLNLRDEARATALADTALVMTRACLDKEIWGPAGAFTAKLDMERVCNIVLGIFARGRVDVPGVGLSMELPGVQGIGIEKGEIEEIKLVSEGSAIGLAGLRCPSLAAAVVAGDTSVAQQPGQATCPSRTMTANLLRNLLCDGALNDVFEKEHDDGHRYTREDIITNLVDWVDPDDNKIALTTTWQFEYGIGENEDAYWKSHGADYKVKDMGFDSIEELRLIPGVNDQLYDVLVRNVSVFGAAGSGKIDVNQASESLIAKLLRSVSPLGTAVEGATCGQKQDLGIAPQGFENRDPMDALFDIWARMVVQAREVLRHPLLHPESLVAPPFRNPNKFIDVVKDPLKYLMELSPNADANIMLAVYGINETQYRSLQGFFANAQQLKPMLDTKSQLYRLQAQATVGNITRRVTAILKRDTGKVRTLYYREE